MENSPELKKESLERQPLEHQDDFEYRLEQEQARKEKEEAEKKEKEGKKDTTSA